MPEDDLTLLTRAAEVAAEIALRHFQSDPKVWEKADDSPVSEADLEVDAALKALLTEARPEYGWLSEETPDTSDRLGRKRVFVIDPIDGTRSYLEGRRDWCHALAVVEDGRPVAGIVLQPARDRSYTAATGRGAYLNGANLALAPEREDPTILAPKWAMAAEHWPGGLPDVARAFRPSLAYRLALVAEGRFDGMLTLRPTWEWDIAAGVLLLTEAGGVATDGAGADLRFNRESPQSAGIIAGPRGLHRDLVAKRSI